MCCDVCVHLMQFNMNGSRSVRELEQENSELRLKYSRALQLLSEYKRRFEELHYAHVNVDGECAHTNVHKERVYTNVDRECAHTNVHRECVHIHAGGFVPHVDESSPINKHSLLKRYLAIQNNARYNSESPVSIRTRGAPKVGVKKSVWRERLLQHPEQHGSPEQRTHATNYSHTPVERRPHHRHHSHTPVEQHTHSPHHENLDLAASLNSGNVLNDEGVISRFLAANTRNSHFNSK